MSTETPSPYSVRNPFPARHITNIKLTGANSEKDTRHHEISLAGSGISYLPGDALGLKATNCPALVEEVVTALKATGEEPVTTRSGAVKPLRQALFEDYAITFTERKFVEAAAQKGAADLAALLAPERADDLRAQLSGKGTAADYVDVLNAHPEISFTAEEFVKLLKPLSPRLYSISSSLTAHPEQVHLTVATVRYNIRGRARKGVCSTFLAERWEGDTTAGVYIQNQQKHFFLPPDGATPIIMVGPGTGVAPFRSFIEERVATGATGDNWLFFGEQRASEDFFYRETIEGWVAGGKLRLDTAFSRDQAHKIYVQNRITERGAEIYDWLERGADFFVCGDKERMAADVDAALHGLIETHGGKTPEQAKEYVEAMKKAKRYKRDVY